MSNELLDKLTKPLVKENPYLHMLFFGPMGGGKSYLSALCAIGLYDWRRQHQSETRPIIMINTEESARWLVKHFEDKKIPVRVSSSRSPADLLKIMDLCEQGEAASLIVDSFTHHWYSFIGAYKAEKHTEHMRMDDWVKVIPAWRDLFSLKLATAPYDYFLCGRSGFEYEYEKDEETGKKKFMKSGVKAKLEGETGYEPDIVVYTTREEELDKDNKPDVWWEATVMKSRAEMLSSKTFRNAGWKEFQPAFAFLLDGAKPSVKIPETDPRGLIGNDSAYLEKKRRREIALEKIEGELLSLAPGQTSFEKGWKLNMLYAIFHTRSWKEVELMDPDKLESGVIQLENVCGRARDSINTGIEAKDVLTDVLSALTTRDLVAPAKGTL